MAVMATNYQKSAIKSYQKLIGIDDDCYREMLLFRFGKSSCTELTTAEAQEFMDELKEKARLYGLYKPKKKSFNKYKYNNLGEREGMATPKQLRMLNASWMTNDNVREKTDSAFESFICRIAKVEKIEWLKKTDVNKCKLAIDNIKAKKDA